MLPSSVHETWGMRAVRPWTRFASTALAYLSCVAVVVGRPSKDSRAIRELAQNSATDILTSLSGIPQVSHHDFSRFSFDLNSFHFAISVVSALDAFAIACFCVGFLILVVKAKRARKVGQHKLVVAQRILELLTTTLDLHAPDLVEGVRSRVEQIMEAIDVDALFLFMEIAEIEGVRTISHSWHRVGRPVSPIDTGVQVPAPIRIGLLNGDQVLIEHVSHMPEDMQNEKEYFLQCGVRSCLAAPLKRVASVRGGLVCLRRAPGTWPAEIVHLLTIGAGVLAHVAKNQALERARHETDLRFRAMADSAPFMIWIAGIDRRYTYYNSSWLDFTGQTLEHALKAGTIENVHVDDLERWVETNKAAFETRSAFRTEYRLHRFDGEYRWVVDVGSPRFDSGGTFVGYIGFCFDVDDSKKMHDALGNLSGRLIAAQEEERFRIARELHDDLSQRMALVLIRLEQVCQHYPEMPREAMNQLAEIGEIADEVAESIHQLSRELHPSRLEHLGLGPALGRLCREFSEQYGLQVEFIQRDIPKAVPRDIALCFYRVSQEALRNIIKHSGAVQASITIWASADQIELRVWDNGTGFDSESVEKKGGMGLLSMRERVRLLEGELSVISQPSHGTEIQARVPLLTSASQGQEGSLVHSRDELSCHPISRGTQ